MKETGALIRTTYGDGRWFPAGRDALAAEVEQYLARADVQPPEQEIVGGIAPHAGYIYSGKIAAYTFRALMESAAKFGAPDTIVILGFCHSLSFPGVALMDGDAVVSPLGKTALDREAAETLINQSPHIFFDYRPHQGEHSAENQIPFAQLALPDTKLVVALMGDHDPGTVAELVDALALLSEQRKLVVVASTDLLHDADYDKVTASDHQTLKMISMLDGRGLAGAWSFENQVCCGISPVLTLIGFAERMGRKAGQILAYCNSGDDWPESRGSWVVGYGSVVF